MFYTFFQITYYNRSKEHCDMKENFYIVNLVKVDDCSDLIDSLMVKLNEYINYLFIEVSNKQELVT